MMSTAAVDTRLCQSVYIHLINIVLVTESEISMQSAFSLTSMNLHSSGLGILAGKLVIVCSM